jgi:histidine triad (HIT) family protein
VAGTELASVRYEDDTTLVFENIRTWAPVMLLVVSKRHLNQEQMWEDMAHYAQVALQMGRLHCPGGFRILSNFGNDGGQSQDHAHLHVLGGRYLGRYLA